ncbi:MAG TPA: heavy metal-associated domain-containing protein [Bryobacteraceae bacterium]|nr:heavy metal-associated domain-containing protein [Bryobacteraceae bacterium]
MRIQIDGMHCEACVRRVRKALEKTPGVIVDEVQVGYADVSVPAGRESEAVEAIRQAGFQPRA